MGSTSISGIVSSMTVVGTVLPVPGAEVFVNERDWEPITTTNSSGAFHIEDICMADLVLTFRADQYVEEVVEEVEEFLIVNMTSHGKI